VINSGKNIKNITAVNNQIEATGIKLCEFSKAGCPCASFKSFGLAAHGAGLRSAPKRRIITANKGDIDDEINGII
jgi:hypothetical protein